MSAKTMAALLTMMMIAACGGEQTNSEGNGPGNADGFGGKEDPPAAPVTEPTVPATDVPVPNDDASSARE